MGSLNVLIGPNGSGKSNLLEVLSLLSAAPTNLPKPVKEMGGVREWLWKRPSTGRQSAREDATTSPTIPPTVPVTIPSAVTAPRKGEAVLEATVDNPKGRQPLRHELVIVEHGDRFEVADESVENERAYSGKADAYFFYRFQRGDPVLNGRLKEERRLRRETIRPDQSILSQVRDPDRYPELSWLQQAYESIRLFRSWSFGPTAALRREQSAQGRADFLSDGGENLPLVLSKIRPRVKPELLESLNRLYDGIEDIHLTVDGGSVQLFLEEAGGRAIPATRLSDGTLRYLCLLAILLHPEPPPLIAIEEPELGLHPDAIPVIADLLIRARERTQLVVTTHSRMLVDALSKEPQSVIVCEKEDGESHFNRLEASSLNAWLQAYSLGTLWSMGELGGNRW
jgi:predicted ATPase